MTGAPRLRNQDSGIDRQGNAAPRAGLNLGDSTMGKITTFAGAVCLATAAVALDPGAASANRLTASGIVTVIGTSDAGMCVKAMSRDDRTDASYWCTRTIRRAESSAGDRAVAHMNLGVLHLQAGRLDLARDALEDAIQLAPDYGDAHFQRGNLLFSEGRFAEAVMAYDRALASAPSTPDVVHYNRGRAYGRLGQADKAEADLDRARSLMPEDSPLRQRLSSAR